MADSKKSIKEAYDEGIAEVFMIVGSLDATPTQRRLAKQTAKDLSSMLVAHTLQTIEGRTALLAGLIVELSQVIDAVQLKPPYEEAVKNFTGLLAKAQGLFKEEKKALV
jgi:hypothetical protein